MSPKNVSNNIHLFLLEGRSYFYLFAITITISFVCLFFFNDKIFSYFSYSDRNLDNRDQQCSDDENPCFDSCASSFDTDNEGWIPGSHWRRPENAWKIKRKRENMNNEITKMLDDIWEISWAKCETVAIAIAFSEFANARVLSLLHFLTSYLTIWTAKWIERRRKRNLRNLPTRETNCFINFKLLTNSQDCSANHRKIEQGLSSMLFESVCRCHQPNEKKRSRCLECQIEKLSAKNTRRKQDCQ